MKYDVFISDFDGTLARSDRSVSENTVRAIEEYRKKGGVFAVCTGRALDSILPVLTNFGIGGGLVATFQGAVIYDIDEGKVIREDVFPVEDALFVIEMLDKKGLHIQTYTRDKFYCNRKDEGLEWYERVCKIKAEIIPDLYTFEKENRLGFIKFVIICEEEEALDLLGELSDLLGEKFLATRSAPKLVEVTLKNQNKGEAVRFLANYYGVPVERVASSGDQLNDALMLEASGGKYVVENGVEELKKIATVIVPSNDEDGVAWALKDAMGETL